MSLLDLSEDLIERSLVGDQIQGRDPSSVPRIGVGSILRTDSDETVEKQKRGRGWGMTDQHQEPEDVCLLQGDSDMQRSVSSARVSTVDLGLE